MGALVVLLIELVLLAVAVGIVQNKDKIDGSNKP
jgi:hypothetical protein